MTVATDSKYNIRPFVQAPTVDSSKYPVITLDAIDLSSYQDGPEGLEARKKLAQQLEKTISTLGFFNITNFGYDNAKLEHLKAIAQSTLELSYEEQAKYFAGAATAELDLENKKKGLGAERGEGYKPRGFWKLKTQSERDSITLINFRDPKILSALEAKRDKFPEVFVEHYREIHDYYNYLHTVVLRKILALCDLILEIPEGTLYDRFFTISETKPLNEVSSGHGRFMLYHPVDEEEATEVDGTWLRGHSDISAFSIITSQPILSLQIQDYETGEWKYVDYRPNSLVCNVGDALEFLTGGYFKASLHKVLLPPKEQWGYQRLVLIDFINPIEDTIIHPTSIDSPKLRSLGLQDRTEWDKIRYTDWDDVKGKLLGADGVGDKNKLVYYGRQVERWHHKQH